MPIQVYFFVTIKTMPSITSYFGRLFDWWFQAMEMVAFQTFITANEIQVISFGVTLEFKSKLHINNFLFTYSEIIFTNNMENVIIIQTLSQWVRVSRWVGVLGLPRVFEVDSESWRAFLAVGIFCSNWSLSFKRPFELLWSSVESFLFLACVDLLGKAFGVAYGFIILSLIGLGFIRTVHWPFSSSTISTSSSESSTTCSLSSNEAGISWFEPLSAFE